MANIKISQLPNINGNLTSQALMPIVSTNGTFITDKVTVATLANFILGESGNLFASADIANLAYNVINASQPNITTVGTLTGLTVVGTTNVGYPNNFVMLGGTAGQVLATFGNGSLGWVDQIGATGVIGNDGATGATGPEGATGPIGPPGPASTIGATGATGETGATGAFNNTFTANVDANGFNISNAGNITANYFIGTATNVEVEAVNNNYSYHIVLTTDPGDTTLHNDADDNLQYNPADGVMTVTRVDMDYLSVGTSVLSNLNPISNVTYDLGNTTNRWKDIWLANSTIHLGDIALSVSDSGQLSTSQLIDGGEGIGGISFVEWTTASELYIRTNDNSVFIPIFESLKINDSFKLLTGGAPANTVLTVTNTISTTTPVSGYVDFNIPVDSAPGSNVFIYLFTLTRAPVTLFDQLTGNTITLGNAVLTANGNTLVVDNIEVTNGNIGTIGNIANINLDGNVSSVLAGDGTWVSAGGFGATGATGPAGSNGSDGATGATGTAGVDGATGATGSAGTNGSDGATGASGPGFVWQGAWQPIPTTYVGGRDVVSYAGSSYIKIGDGNSGSAPPDDPVRWSVMAEEGAVGAVGATGPAGSNGSDGATGATGPAGTNGSDGATGATGPQGDTGATGPSGIASLPIANGNSNFDIATVDGNVTITANSTSTWTFGTDGLLTLPSGNVVIGSIFGADAILASNTPFGVVSQGNGSAVLQWIDDISNASALSAIYINSPSGGAGDVVVLTGAVGPSANIWNFTANGNLVLPNGNSVIYSIANSSLDPTLPNVSTMTLTPDANYNSQVLVLDPTAPGHIHLRAYAFSNIDDPAANIFLGGENTAFEITSGANNQAVIHSNGKAWTFGNDGNISSDTLTFTTTFANVKTVEYQTAGVWDLYVEDSITGSNTAISRLNVSFKDNLIDKPQVYIENTKESDGIALRWTFDENGNLNFPRDVAGNTDPYLNIFGGSTPTIQSTDVSLAGPANLAIQADYLNLSGFSGDKIVFYADTGEMATDANMTLTTNLANTGNTSSWVFGTDGNLTLPAGGSIYSEGFTPSGNPGNTITLNPHGSGSITNQKLLVYPTAGDGDHIHLTSGNLYQTELFLGSDNLFVKLANTGNIVINSDDNAGNTAQWKFGIDGNLTLPDTTSVIANVSITLEANDSGNITGLSLIGDSNANLYAHGNVTIVSDSSNTTATWSFVNTGDIVLPNDVVIGDDGSNGLTLSVPTVTPGTYSDWTFDQSGNLTLPGNTVAINFANGSSAFGNIVATNLDGNVSNVLNGNGTFVALPVINANTVVWSTAPVANTSNGTAGEAAYDSGGNLYVCVSANTWAKFTGTTSW
jgi:hypothetical protein